MKKGNDWFLSVLACPRCRSALLRTTEMFICTQCKKTYAFRAGVPHFLGTTLANRYEEEAATPVNRLKTYLKKNPAFFQLLHYNIGSVSYFGLSAKGAIWRAFGRSDLSKKVMLNVGSGIKRVHSQVINQLLAIYFFVVKARELNEQSINAVSSANSKNLTAIFDAVDDGAHIFPCDCSCDSFHSHNVQYVQK